MAITSCIADEIDICFEGVHTVDLTERRPTAKIYSFPIGGRTASIGRDRAGRTPKPEMAVIDVSGGWYHADAIREAGQTRKT